MSLPRRSQSALEYMMTYGWAILVIVIVAAVLYSLGIFSPSSSLSTTITGFSNLGTVNAVCLGGTSFTISMGDSTGYSINITQINLTSSSGKTTYSPNILIQPNSIQTVTVPSSSLCTSGARYSVSAVISYLEPGQVFQGPYASTGTVSGTAASPPPSATSYEPLNITNTQNQGTPSPFQQMINITSSTLGWADISLSPFGQNVEFFSATGQILDSWLENYTSTHAVWWVKLTSSIPAGSKQTIYMGFAPTSTNLFNTVNDGEAPQLSSTYAEYDDGFNLFYYYNNFENSASLNGWSSAYNPLPPVSSADDGLHLSSSSGGSYGYFSPSDYLYITLFQSFSNASYARDGFGGPNTAPTYWLNGAGGNGNYGVQTYNLSNDYYGYSIPSTVANQTYPLSMYFLNRNVYSSINFVNYITGGVKMSTPAKTGVFFQLNSGKMIIFYIALANLAPEGVMPSVMFGSVS